MGRETLSNESDPQQQFERLHEECKQYLDWASSAGFTSFRGIFYHNMAKEREDSLANLVKDNLEKSKIGSVNFDEVEHVYRKAHPLARRIDVIDEIINRVQFCPFPNTTFEKKISFGVQHLSKYPIFSHTDDSNPLTYVSHYPAAFPTVKKT